MSGTAYRMILLVLGLAFITVVVGAVLFAPSGSEPGHEPPLERVEPSNGSLVFGNPVIVVDLEPGYRAHLMIDDVPIPDTEVAWTPATGLHVFRPGPGKTLEHWTPGFHVVSARWDGASGVPDPGTYEWSFRVQ